MPERHFQRQGGRPAPGRLETWRQLQARAAWLLVRLLIGVFEVLVACLESFRLEREHEETETPEDNTDPEDSTNSSVIDPEPERAEVIISENYSMRLRPVSLPEPPPPEPRHIPRLILPPPPEPRQEPWRIPPSPPPLRTTPTTMRAVIGGPTWTPAEIARGYPDLQQMPQGRQQCPHLRVKRYASHGGKGYKCRNCRGKYFRSANGRLTYREDP